MITPSQNTGFPKEVKVALGLLGLALGLGVARGVSEALSGLLSGGTAFSTFLALFVIGVIFVMIAARKNWARFAYLVLFLLGLVVHGLPMIRWLASNPTAGLVGSVQISLQIAALVLLFRPRTSTWFYAEAK